MSVSNQTFFNQLGTDDGAIFGRGFGAHGCDWPKSDFERVILAN